MFKIELIGIEYSVEINIKLIVVGINIKNLKILLVFCENYFFFNYDYYVYIITKDLKVSQLNHRYHLTIVVF